MTGHAGTAGYVAANLTLDAPHHIGMEIYPTAQHATEEVRRWAMPSDLGEWRVYALVDVEMLDRT